MHTANDTFLSSTDEWDAAITAANVVGSSRHECIQSAHHPDAKWSHLHNWAGSPEQPGGLSGQKNEDKISIETLGNTYNEFLWFSL